MKKLLISAGLALALSPTALANDRLEAACLADLQSSPLPPDVSLSDLAPACTCLAETEDQASVDLMLATLDQREAGEAVDFPEAVQPIIDACFPADDVSEEDDD